MKNQSLIIPRKQLLIIINKKAKNLSGMISKSWFIKREIIQRSTEIKLKRRKKGENKTEFKSKNYKSILIKANE